MRKRIIGAAFCIAFLAVSAAAQSGCDGCGGPPAASITVGGSEQQVSGVWDTKPITISFNGFTETVSPGQFSTTASIASAFAGKFSRDYEKVGLSAQVICTTSKSIITFALPGGFGAVDVTGSTTSFQMTPAGFASVISVAADSGTVTLTVGGVTAATTNYGEGATPTTVAAGLAAGVTAGSFVNIGASGSALLLQAKQSGAGTNYSYSVQTTSYDSVDFTQPSFVYPPLTGVLSGGANAGSGTSSVIYSSTNTYDATGNVQSYSDSVMGNWTFNYDSLNRLQTGNASTGPYSSQHVCWAYDSFGNRTAQSIQTAACPTSEASVAATTTYSSANRVTGTSVNSATTGFSYDNAGDVTNDNLNQYLYDAEGRICAVYGNYKLGGTMTGYLYGADGTRIAKGTITTMSCDPTVNGFKTTNDYILSSSNQQITEMVVSQGALAWQHTNAWADGKLLATYDKVGLHFYFDDALGTRRAQTDYAGVLEKTCVSLPYGDAETCPPSPTEHLFTGKERDAESGNDYFGARYYASSMGRWMSPDRPFADQHLDNPQSWNLYAYAENNPLYFVDPNGEGLVTASSTKIGEVVVTGYTQQTTVDTGELLATDKHDVTELRPQDLQNNKSAFNIPKQDNSGGCVLGCFSAWTQESYAFSVSISFSYDSHQNLTGASINLPQDKTMAFIGPNPPAGVTVGGFLPGSGGLPPGPTVSATINPGALKGLSDSQLVALAVAASRFPIPAVGNAVHSAVAKEQAARDQKKKEPNQCDPQNCSSASFSNGFLSH